MLSLEPLNSIFDSKNNNNALLLLIDIFPKLLEQLSIIISSICLENTKKFKYNRVKSFPKLNNLLKAFVITQKNMIKFDNYKKNNFTVYYVAKGEYKICGKKWIIYRIENPYISGHIQLIAIYCYDLNGNLVYHPIIYDFFNNEECDLLYFGLEGNKNNYKKVLDYENNIYLKFIILSYTNITYSSHLQTYIREIELLQNNVKINRIVTTINGYNTLDILKKLEFLDLSHSNASEIYRTPNEIDIYNLNKISTYNSLPMNSLIINKHTKINNIIGNDRYFIIDLNNCFNENIYNKKLSKYNFRSIAIYNINTIKDTYKLIKQNIMTNKYVLQSKFLLAWDFKINDNCVEYIEYEFDSNLITSDDFPNIIKLGGCFSSSKKIKIDNNASENNSIELVQQIPDQQIKQISVEINSNSNNILSIKGLKEGEINGEKGFYVYKIVSCPFENDEKCEYANNSILKLFIPFSAKVAGDGSTKFRCDKLIPVNSYVVMKEYNSEEFNIKENITEKNINSSVHNKNFIYKLNKLHVCENFTKDLTKVCSPGFHFCLTPHIAWENYGSRIIKINNIDTFEF